MDNVASCNQQEIFPNNMESHCDFSEEYTKISVINFFSYIKLHNYVIQNLQEGDGL